jgi:hypothetical protein
MALRDNSTGFYFPRLPSSLHAKTEISDFKVIFDAALGAFTFQTLNNDVRKLEQKCCLD